VYPRHIKVGDSEGWCGPVLMTAITRPFTPGEDAVFAWLLLQDDSTLLDIIHLTDGRDYIVFRRQHTRQTLREALVEQETFIAARC